MTPLVLYHKNCMDGFCCAWLISKVMEAELVAIQYGDECPKNVVGRTVYLVDFSFKADVIKQLRIEAQHLTIIDHHVSAVREMVKVPRGTDLTLVLDETKSGARLVQQFFNLPDHWLIDYTEDRDLWRWSLPDSKLINLGLSTYPKDHLLWDSLTQSDCLDAGAVMMRYNGMMVKDAVSHAVDAWIRDQRCMVVNNTRMDLTSEIAGQLSEKYGVGACYVVSPSGRYTYSLRSSSVDISLIAEYFGGGGHKAAAGFSSNGPVHSEA